MSEERFLLIGDVARMLRRSEQMVRQYVDSGKLPATRAANGFRLFKESDVKRLARQLEEAHKTALSRD